MEAVNSHISWQTTPSSLHLKPTRAFLAMPHTFQSPRDAATRPWRSLIHTLTKTFLITLSVVFFATVLILSFLDPDLVLSFLSSLKPIILFVIEAAAELVALYLLYSLAQALHLCYYMSKRQDERNKHQAQLFGHGKVWFVDE